MQQIFYVIEHHALGKVESVRFLDTEQEALLEAEQLNKELPADLAECNSFHAVKYIYTFSDTLDECFIETEQI